MSCDGEHKYQGINGAKVMIEQDGKDWRLQVDNNEVVVFFGQSKPTHEEVQMQIDLWRGV